MKKLFNMTIEHGIHKGCEIIGFEPNDFGGEICHKRNIIFSSKLSEISDRKARILGFGYRNGGFWYTEMWGDVAMLVEYEGEPEDFDEYINNIQIVVIK